MLREFHRVLPVAGAVVISTTHPLYDWQRVCGSYFALEAVCSSLNPDRGWPVRAWRRPLTHVCREFRDAGFVIDELVEPRPVPEMAASDPPPCLIIQALRKV